MRILVLGSGGREHALVWKLAQEADVFCAPGNAGIAQTCGTYDLDLMDFPAIESLAKHLKVDFVVVGPEAPLIGGLADFLRSAGVPTVGPNAQSAMLEGSKAFAKRAMVEAGVPTADYGEFTNAGVALKYIAEMFAQDKCVAVKASGSALGKGVTVCLTQAEAEQAVHLAMVERVFGEAGDTVVIEECLHGREFSLITLVSGSQYRSLPIAQDYKRAFDGDRGPNTGGMGTYSPVPWLDDALIKKTEEAIVAPLLKSLTKYDFDYRGVLFSGVMVVNGNPFCLEFNVRFGDPETQSIVRRIGAGFAATLEAVAKGKPIPEIEVLDNAVVSVVMASEGYPGKYKKGRSVSIPDDLDDDVVIFHAGTSKLVGGLVTSGGRVLSVTATGASLGRARKSAYAAVEKIEFKGRQFRTDIGA